MQAKSAGKNILEQASAWANNNPTTLLVIVLVGAAVFILILALAVFTCRRVRTRRQARVAEVARQIDSPDPSMPLQLTSPCYHLQLSALFTGFKALPYTTESAVMNMLILTCLWVSCASTKCQCPDILMPACWSIQTRTWP